jgi:hypothetical protein
VRLRVDFFAVVRLRVVLRAPVVRFRVVLRAPVVRFRVDFRAAVRFRVPVDFRARELELFFAVDFLVRPCFLRALFTVAAAISFARFDERPRLEALFLIFAYLRSSLLLQALGMMPS